MKKNKASVIRIIVLALIAAVILYPLLLTLITSLKSVTEYFQNRVSLPHVYVLENYVRVYQEAHIVNAFSNSFVITVGSLAGQLLFGTMAAYALTKTRMKRAKLYTNLFLIPMVFTAQLVVFPLYLMFNAMHMVNSDLALILIYIASAMPITVFMLARFMLGIPDALTESARIDGANHVTIYMKIIIPLTKVALATLVVINGMYVWNDFFLPSIFLSGVDKRTLPQGVVLFQGQYLIRWPQLCADVVYTVIPILVVYLFLQKYIISGLVAGAVKE